MRGLRNQVVCVVVALLIWLLSPAARSNLFTTWVYSTAIGTSAWFFIDGSRILLALWLTQEVPAADARPSRWPGPRWMLVCILGGSALGYSLGTALGDAITGLHTPGLVLNRPAIVITVIAALAATWYFYATERLRQEKSAAETARRAAAESQLMLLQSQLEPHMLFNTLANLRVLITLDPPRAQAMLDRLIAYLRATLGASRSTLHPLATEFARLDDYLALMALRMGPRLQVRLDLPEPLRALPVPPLLLQPLVENAIRHGLEPQVAGGRLEVRAAQQGDDLVLTVRDTGAGLQDGGATPGGADTPPSSHYGTRHVAERLATLYGERGRLRLSPADDGEGGCLAEVRLPLPAGPRAPAAGPPA
jgi:signal transduction histidine kinase